jgi:hypothetical protein
MVHDWCCCWPKPKVLNNLACLSLFLLCSLTPDSAKYIQNSYDSYMGLACGVSGIKLPGFLAFSSPIPIGLLVVFKNREVGPHGC